MWHYVKPEDFAIQDADSLGTELHVKIGLGLAEIATYMGIAYVGLGEYDMAEKQFREALNEATSRDFGHLSLYIRSNLVYVLVERGDLEEAGLLAEKNLVSAIAIDNLEMQENALVYLSHIAAFRTNA